MKQNKLEEMMLVGLRKSSDAELADILRTNPEFVPLLEAVRNEAMARMVERLPAPPKKEPIEVRLIEAEYDFTAKTGFKPSRLEIGADERNEVQEWLMDLARRNILHKDDTYTGNPYFRGIELRRATTRLGITVRQ